MSGNTAGRFFPFSFQVMGQFAFFIYTVRQKKHLACFPKMFYCISAKYFYAPKLCPGKKNVIFAVKCLIIAVIQCFSVKLYGKFMRKCIFLLVLGKWGWVWVNGTNLVLQKKLGFYHWFKKNIGIENWFLETESYSTTGSYLVVPA